jgi:hypothetical protein
MTDRIIKVDALLRALADRKPRAIHNPPVAIGYGQAMCDLEEIISEIATTAPETQESVSIDKIMEVYNHIKSKQQEAALLPSNKFDKKVVEQVYSTLDVVIKAITKTPTKGTNHGI